ncbi:MAG TPA: hypothetical protein PLV92_21775, partial [Pirellulaceae bacterium]|nr:hypothetical protein [Pirellulaceae bacterium]
MFAVSPAQWARRLWRQAVRSRGQRQHRLRKQLRLSLEPLEDRRLLAVVKWINAAGGAWNVGANWDTGAVPTAADDVTIDVANANVTITHSAGADTVRSLTTNETVALSGGTLTVTTTLDGAGSLTLSGGTLASATV